VEEDEEFREEVKKMIDRILFLIGEKYNRFSFQRFILIKFLSSRIVYIICNQRTEIVFTLRGDDRSFGLLSFLAIVFLLEYSECFYQQKSGNLLSGYRSFILSQMVFTSSSPSYPPLTLGVIVLLP